MNARNAQDAPTFRLGSGEPPANQPLSWVAGICALNLSRPRPWRGQLGDPVAEACLPAGRPLGLQWKAEAFRYTQD